MTVPLQLQRIIGAHLGTTSKVATASFLGLHASAWWRYLSGRRSPTEATINRWLSLCNDAGITVPASVGEALSVASP